ncbi:GNA1162 family protein [Breoghania sp.]|uniref:GNA1162 family protein n=1 Tax=Breoghania sp. TaxID=2065378 RepID=UPI0029C7746A|nr:GNA1162 family protein [Breoghania sp.]
MISSVRFPILIVLSVMLLACSYEQQYIRHDQIQARARYVAVLPMVNLSSYPHAGRIVGDILTTELYAQSGFHLMEQSLVISRLRQNALEIDDALDKTEVLDAARELGVDTVIYGSVSEYRYKRGLNEDPVVGVNLRMIDAKSKKVLWAGSKSKTGGCFWFCEDSLNRLAQEVCNDLVAEMVAQ